MKNPKSTTVSTNDPKVVANVNFNRRIAASQEFFGVHVDTYNLPDIIQQIKDAGRVLTPLVFSRHKDGSLILLQGYRRWLGTQALLRDPNISAELLSNLQKVPALVYDDMTAADEWEILNDHGDRLDTANAELVLAIFDDYENGRSEKDIIRKRYYNIAKYTGSLDKLRNLPDDPAARQKYLQTWLHGTVGNYLLGVWRLGERFRKALYLTELWADGKLKEDTDPKPEFKMSRSRFKEIADAITQDKKTEQWNEEERTGPALEGVIETFKTEDKTGKKDRGISTRPKEKDLQDRKNNARSTAAKLAFAVSLGEAVENFRVVDDATARMEMVADLIGKNLDQISDPRLKDTLTRVLHSHPADFEKFLVENSEVATELGDGPDQPVKQEQKQQS